ncbi:MAG: hypothetical protein E7329_07240, partial [Clostridiales bacterium]|nr:hypothetical protein [Clostridiales bacterium]
EARVIEEAQGQVDRMDLVEEKAIVVMGEGWNSGVVGLAAGRIAEKYAYPTVALARDGDTCVGSARSAGDVDIHVALSQCADLFLRFGGHKQAAGLTIPFEKVEELKSRFSRAVAEQTGGRAPVAEFLCDGEMDLSQVTAETVGQLSQLEPYGMGNPAPRFLCQGAEALSLRAVGVQGKHLKCTFRQGNHLRDGIFFGGGEWAGTPGGQFQLVMAPTLNVFRGRVSAECFLQAMQLLPHTLPTQPEKEALALLMEKRAAKAALPLNEAGLAQLMEGSQGTLLVCRTLETALAMHRRYPEADFSLGQAMDPRAYHTVMLYGRADQACASFRHVVLCDGDLSEAAAYQASCPKARIYALPETKAVKRLLAACFLAKDQLRNCYRLLREHTFRDLDIWAEQAGVSRNQGAFALAVFSEIGLIACSFQPLSLSLLPMVRRDPEESVIYQAAQKAKEEADGVYGV